LYTGNSLQHGFGDTVTSPHYSEVRVILLLLSCAKSHIRVQPWQKMTISIWHQLLLFDWYYGVVTLSALYMIIASSNSVHHCKIPQSVW